MTRPLAPGAFFPWEGSLRDLSGAYPNDSAVDVATIRRYGGKYGSGVAVEPTITNLILQADFDTKGRSWNPTDGDNSIGGTLLVDGWRRFPRFGATTQNSQIYWNASYSVTTGDRVTESILFRVDGSGVPPGLKINFFTNNGNHTGTGTVITDLGNGLYQLSATYLVVVGDTAIRAINIDLNAGWNANSTFMDVLEPMLFKHVGVEATVTEPIHSSFTYGTRANGILKYAGAILPRTAGSISCWIRPNYDYINFPSADRHGIVSAVTTDTVDDFVLRILEGSGALQWATRIASVVTTLSYTPANWDPTRMHHIALTWSDTEQVLYYDGVRRASRSGAFTRWSATTWVTIGTCTTPSSANDWLDGLVDDLAIVDRQLTDAQIAAIFGLGSPFVGEASLGSAGEQAEFVHLIEMQFSGGTIYLNTGASDLSWNGQLWEAVGGLLTIGGVESSGDSAAQGVELKLSGIDQSVLGALMTSNYRGRIVRLRRAYLDSVTGTVRRDPVFLFEGLQLSPYTIEEQRGRNAGTVTITTRIMGYLGLDRIAGIWANVTSHQHYFPGDTFFQYVASLANLKVYWGTQAPLGIGPPTPPTGQNPPDPGDQGYDTGWT